MKRLLLLLGLSLSLAATPFALAAGAGGVTGPAFYVDGVLYRTVNTPTDLSTTGAPAHSFDTIYALAGQPFNVATAAPGDRGLQRRPLAGPRDRLQHGLGGHGRGARRERQRRPRQRDRNPCGARGSRRGRGDRHRSRQEFVCPVIKLKS